MADDVLTIFARVYADHAFGVGSPVTFIAKDFSRAALAALAEAGGFVGLWRTMDKLPDGDDMVLAYRPDVQAYMVWKASILKRNLAGPTPGHLSARLFTKWMLLAALPAPPGEPTPEDYEFPNMSSGPRRHGRGT